MPILAVCPHCQQNYHVDEKFAGKKANCQACGQSFTVPVPAHDPLGDAAALASALPSLAPPESTVAPLPSPSPLGKAGGYTAPAPYAAAEHRPGRSSSLDLSAGEPVEWALRPGIKCSVVGIFGFLLPLMGMQFRMLAVLGPAASVVGGLFAIAGAILLFLALRDNVIKAVGASLTVIVLSAGAFLLSLSVAAVQNEQAQELAKPVENQPAIQPGNAAQPANLAQRPADPAAQPAAVALPVSAIPAMPAGATGSNIPQPNIPGAASAVAPAGLVGQQLPAEPPAPPASKLKPLNLAPPSVALPLLAAAGQVSPNGNLRGREPDFSDHAPEGGWLVGLRVIQSPNWGGAILAVQPIYQVEDKYVSGTLLCGTSQVQSETLLLAKPGYAISGLRYYAGLVVNSVQVEFREVSGQRLIAEGAYASLLIGCEGGSLQPVLHGKGEPIRGIDGTGGRDLTSLRLYY